MNDTFSPRLIWGFRLNLQKHNFKKIIMKTKITYLLFLLPLMTFAQGPWEFNTAGNAEGWTVPAANTATQSGTDLRVDFVTGAAQNPVISNASPGINADTDTNFIEIRLKNLSLVSYLRFGVNGANYANKVITTNDADYKTYVVDVTAWTGNPILNFQILCKTNSGTTAGSAYVCTTGQYILIDYIRPLAVLPTPAVSSFTFDTTVEGFDKLTRSSAVQATESGRGTLQVKYVSGSNNALNALVGLNSLTAHVEGSNKYAHITLKNASTNTQFQIRGKVATVATLFSPVQTFTPSDADYKTYDFDLSTWDSGYQFPELNVAVKDTWSAAPTTYAINDIVVVSNTYYKSLTGDNTAVDAAALKLDTANWVIVNAAGAVADATPATNGAVIGGALDMTNSIYIDSIVFDNTAPALGTTNFGYANNTISLYPNPANDVLNVSSSNKISKIEVYDLLGRKVASKNNASDVNVAALGKGAYIVKVVKENGSVVAKRFIKQ